MAGEPKPNSLIMAALLSAMLLTVCASAQTIRHHQVELTSDLISEPVAKAENAIGLKDYATAEKLLLGAVSNPVDGYRAWFDLAEVYRLTNRNPYAIDAYKKALAKEPNLYEADLNLGLLLLHENQESEAAKYLQAGLNRMPESASPEFKSSMWFAFGRALEANNLVEAVSAYRKASGYNQQGIEPHLKAAKVLASQKDVEGSAAEYHRVLELSPRHKEAMAGLIDLYRENDRPAEASAALRNYAAQFPEDPKVHLMLGQSLFKSGDADGAMKEFEQGLKASPDDETLLHEVAAAYASQKKFALAEPKYADLIKARPDHALYRYQYGVVLMQLHKFPEAQAQLTEALKRDGRIQDAYDQLALAASENKQYPLTIRVLDARAKLAPDTPGTYFLRATAYDNLKAFSQAAENYHKFLDASNGQFPDNEWKARHRLIAIEPLAGKKKKS
jgi:tetratricopeptide (TPR) repeat protein